MDDAEWAQLLQLMKEYTEKLREISDAHAAARYRKIQAIFITVMVACIAGVALIAVPSLVYLSVAKNYGPIVAGSTAIMAVLLASVVSLFSPTSRRTVYDAHSLASIVENLVRTVSQYNEHSDIRGAGKFEISLRLAEADAAIRVYREVFGVKTGLSAILP